MPLQQKLVHSDRDKAMAKFDSIMRTSKPFPDKVKNVREVAQTYLEGKPKRLNDKVNKFVEGSLFPADKETLIDLFNKAIWSTNMSLRL